MGVFASLPPAADGTLSAVRGLLGSMLTSGQARAVLVMMETHDGRGLQPALVTSRERLERANPLLPVMPISISRMASLVSQRNAAEAPVSSRIAVVARPCELRAMVELAKLNQLRMEEMLTIGVDCVGTLEGAEWRRWADSDDRALERSLESARRGEVEPPQAAYRHACMICETPTAWDADLSLHWVGLSGGLLVEARDSAGLEALGLTPTSDVGGRAEAVAALRDARHARRTERLDAVQAELKAGSNDLPGLITAFEACQRCHNCTVACPICYCKECLFRTETFSHEPRRYFGWSERKGAARLPGDAIAFQLTRLCHVTTSCVGCGMCTSACPADLPVDSLFQSVARQTQALFGYVPGRSLDDPLPPATFERKEFVELGEVRR